MTSKLMKTEQVIKWVAVKNINVVWVQSQRRFDEKEAARIRAEFDPDAFGIIQVTLPNGAGIYHCIDGQTRVGAIKEMWGENEQVPCNIISALDPQRAADIFTKINTVRRHVQAIEAFNVAVTAGYEIEVGVNKLLNGLGFRVVNENGEGVIRCIRTCVSIYRSLGPKVLKEALILIKGTWGQDQGAMDASIIRGYAMFEARYGREIDKERLVDNVAKKLTPGNVRAQAKLMREMFKGGIAMGVMRVLVETYNRGLRTGKIKKPE